LDSEIFPSVISAKPDAGSVLGCSQVSMIMGCEAVLRTHHGPAAPGNYFKASLEQLADT
jgi:hypothetical protein